MSASTIPIKLEHLLTSPEHIYKGHYGGASGNCPCEHHGSIRLVAGKGIEGDRYFGFREDFKGQITFFDLATIDALAEFSGEQVAPEAVRRNVLMRGVDLNTLIGKRFSMQGVHFEGTEECRPCFWMDEAVAPGTEEFLKGRGGLRARILSDGALTLGAADLVVEA